MAIKQQEVSQKLFGDLLTRYQVRIMPPCSEKEEPGQPEKRDGSDEEEKQEAASQRDDALAQPEEEKTR